MKTAIKWMFLYIVILIIENLFGWPSLFELLL